MTKPLERSAVSDDYACEARPLFLLAVWTAAFLATAPVGAEVLLRDDFSGPCVRYELLGGSAWRMKEGAGRFVAPGGECFAVANLEELGEARIEATVEVDRRLGTGYVAAGLVLFGDSDNHWRLLGTLTLWWSRWEASGSASCAHCRSWRPPVWVSWWRCIRS